MWENLELSWQRTLELAWEAFCVGTVPVGCVIVDTECRIVAEGRNAIYDRDYPWPFAGSNLAHAEMMALSRIRESEHPNIREYTLYTSLEPCPMCFGAINMMHVRRIRCGARDAIAGSLVLAEATPYLRSKRYTIEYGDPVLEDFQLVLVAAYELSDSRPRDRVVAIYEQANPRAVAVGRRLFQSGYFHTAVQESFSAGRVFTDVVKELQPVGAGKV